MGHPHDRFCQVMLLLRPYPSRAGTVSGRLVYVFLTTPQSLAGSFKAFIHWRLQPCTFSVLMALSSNLLVTGA